MSEIGHNGGPALRLDEPESHRPGNWFAVSRNIFEHPVVGIRGRAYTDFEAWLSLIAMASYDQTEVKSKGRTIVLEPGDLMHAHGFLAERWGWTVDKVRWFLNRLQTEAMIARHCNEIRTKQSTRQDTTQNTTRNTNQIQIISICNYAKYQLLKEAEHQAARQAKSQASRHAKRRQVNKETLGQEESPPTPQAGGDPRVGLGRKLARQAFDEWRVLAKRLGLPTPREDSFTETRARAIFARMKEHGGTHPTPESMMAIWRLALQNVERSKFLRGMTDRGFRADLQFLCQSSSFSRLIEGTYGNGAHATDMAPDNSDMLDQLAAARRVTEGDYG